jgi:predicted glycosyltransferase
VGGDLLAATIGASIHLRQQLPHRLLMFHGPHADEELRLRLHRLATGHDHIEVRDFTPALSIMCWPPISPSAWPATTPP